MTFSLAAVCDPVALLEHAQMELRVSTNLVLPELFRQAAGDTEAAVPLERGNDRPHCGTTAAPNARGRLASPILTPGRPHNAGSHSRGCGAGFRRHPGRVPEPLNPPSPAPRMSAPALLGPPRDHRRNPLPRVVQAATT
jgi:hypothetical protein